MTSARALTLRAWTAGLVMALRDVPSSSARLLRQFRYHLVCLYFLFLMGLIMHFGNGEGSEAAMGRGSGGKNEEKRERQSTLSRASMVDGETD